LQAEHENESEFNETMEEELNKAEIPVENGQSDQHLPVDESKVIDEINIEIKNLSDDSEQEFSIEELEKIGVEELESEKTEEEIPEVNEEQSFPEDEKEEEITKKEKITVKFERDISYFFKGKNIDKIISNIFNDDAEDFAQTFEKLSECNDVEEALAILDALFKSNRVKPSSKEAVLITNIVNEYFNQK
jgi:hypothetical protein